VKLLTGGFKIIPRFDKEWAEILLENLLYKDEFLSKSQPELLESIIKELKLIGALEKRQVFLKENREVKKLLLESINKLDSILGIVRHEYKNLEEGLRLVILSDYIRPEYISQENLELNKLGVLPIFEKLRRHFFGTKKIGVLTGTKVIIPITAREAFEQVSEKMHIEKSHIRFKELHYDSNYLIVDIKGENNQKIVHLVTEVFSLGEIQILIGTKSLLGEGWDAPVINSLILASFVGSFMLSNQMRGRAIRIDKKNPGKISNIWHLASITPNSKYPGYDYSMLMRRFKSFVGLDYKEDKILSGFARMEIPHNLITEEQLHKINFRTLALSSDRLKIHERWKSALAKGKSMALVPEIQVQNKTLPRMFVMYNTIEAMLKSSLYFFF
jgi:hypothetical protein